MNVDEFLDKKISNFISFLSGIPYVQRNEEAMKKLPSFQDVEWTKKFSREIKTEFRRNPEEIIRQIIEQCSMTSTGFTQKELDIFKNYIDIFVSTVERYCK